MSTIGSDSEVFIAGGGPAGLATAIALRESGFGVRLADCALPPIDKACGEGIMPDGLLALARLGINLDTEQAAPFRGIRFISDDDRVEADFSHGVGYGIRRTVLHRIMVERAADAGVSMQWGARITGLSGKGVLVDGQSVRCRWLVCADGQNSKLRRMAGLDVSQCVSRRYGFRRHYQVPRWSDHVEVHWGACGQIYVTPVADDEICVALITRHPHLRFEAAWECFPRLAARLRGVAPERDYLGALTATRKFAAVQQAHVALVGEASGSVDAVTGQGLSMAFQQATALAQALRAGDLPQYEVVHRRIARTPRLMSALMLTMDKRPGFRRRVIRALAAEPANFGRVLAIHTGALSMSDFGVRQGLTLGWHLLGA